MAVSPKSIPIDNLSLSVANLSFSDEKKPQNNAGNSQSQETKFNDSEPASIPLYPQTICASIPSNKDPIFTGFNNVIPAIPPPGFSCRTKQDKKAGYYAFLSLAITPEGSRKLQEIIMAGNPSVTSQVLEWVTSQVSGFPLIYYLMIDPYGCFVCSKLIDSCNKLQLGLLIENIVREDEILVNVSTNLQGAKLMKKFIRLLKGTSYSSLIVLRLSVLFNRLMTNQTGSFVINFCLDWLDIREITPLYQQAISQCLVLATHSIGCVSLNYVIDKIQGFHRQELLELVSKNAVFLSQDPSGNHVVQKVLELENPFCSAVIGSMLRGHYVKLSTQKWGSHVVEKSLKSQAAMEFGLADFLSCGSTQLLQIAKDQFGNYVVQTALKVTKERNMLLHLKLVESLHPHLGMLRFGYGKNIYNLVTGDLYNVV